ncbi:MAG: DUF819 family protein [Verrucomicrobiales bacterium]|nr:DUF819 family protein [Verrucomicrobiales bacterium]
MRHLIASDQTWLLVAFVLAGATASIWIEQRSRWGARLGGPVLALGIAMILSNARILPLEAPVYDVVDDYLVPMAIPLLLLKANLRRILKETGPTFAAFHVATAGSLIGALVAGFLFHGTVARIAEVSGIMAASYIGGAVNFVAVRNTYEVPAELSNPLIVADNFIMAAFFATLILLAGSRWMRRRFRHPHSIAGDATDPAELNAKYWRPKEISLLDVAQALAFAGAIAGVAITLTRAVKLAIPPGVVQSMVANPYVLITFITVAATTIGHAWTDRIRGAEELGMYLLYLFFFVLGVRADLWEVIRNVPALFGVCLVIATINLVFTLTVGRLLGMNLEDLLLSVNATLGGAPSAAAMAISRGWSGLVLPGLLVGIWGYVIGTTLGIVVTETLRRLLP